MTRIHKRGRALALLALALLGGNAEYYSELQEFLDA